MDARDTASIAVLKGTLGPSLCLFASLAFGSSCRPAMFISAWCLLLISGGSASRVCLFYMRRPHVQSSVGPLLPQGTCVLPELHYLSRIGTYSLGITGGQGLCRRGAIRCMSTVTGSLGFMVQCSRRPLEPPRSEVLATSAHIVRLVSVLRVLNTILRSRRSTRPFSRGRAHFNRRSGCRVGRFVRLCLAV